MRRLTRGQGLREHLGDERGERLADNIMQKRLTVGVDDAIYALAQRGIRTFSYETVYQNRRRFRKRRPSKYLLL